MTTWIFSYYNGEQHIVPESEEDEHYFNDCHCGAKYDNGVWVHNSFYGIEPIDLSGIIDKPYGSC